MYYYRGHLLVSQTKSFLYIYDIPDICEMVLAPWEGRHQELRVLWIVLARKDMHQPNLEPIPPSWPR